MENIQNQISSLAWPKIFCGGPNDLDCTESHDICFSVEDKSSESSHAWGLCVNPDWHIHFNTTISASLGDSSSTASVPISTSTKVEVTTVDPPTLVTRTATTTLVTAIPPLPTDCADDLECQENFYCDRSECVRWVLMTDGRDICYGLCKELTDDEIHG